VSGLTSFQMAKRGPLRPTSGKSVTSGFSFAMPDTLYGEHTWLLLFSHFAEIPDDGHVKKQTIGERTTIFSKIL
jgi:hypothetical protein